jgi:hypothetical protein
LLAPVFGQAPGGYPQGEGDEITLEPLRPRTFDKTSPVTAYWLPRCDGFDVVGGRRPAVVERAVYDDDPLHPVGLRVRVGNKRRRLLPIDEVEAVCPLARTLYVRRPPSVTVRAGSAVGTRAGRVVRTTGVASVSAWRAATPRARSAARAAHSAARRRWPAVRRGAAVAGEAAFFALVTLAMFAVWLGTTAVRLLQLGARTTRRYSPVAAALMRRSIAVAHGHVRSGLGTSRRYARRHRPVRVSVPPEPAADDPESLELLDSPLQAELRALRDPLGLDEPEPVQQPAT